MVYKKGHVHSVGNPGGVPKKHTLQFIESLIPSLLAWAKLDDSLVFNTWIAEQGFCQQRISEFSNVSEKFADALRSAKLMVAQRREKLALQGKVDGAMVRFNHFVYDPEYFNALKELKKAGMNENGCPANVNVILSGRNNARASTYKPKGKKK